MADDQSDYMLTTVDNPYNPFTQWDEWWEFDTSHNYNTASYLARITKSSNDLSDADQEQAIDDAMNEIVTENIRGIYKKISANENS